MAKPNYTAQITVTDAAEVTITAATYCAAVYVAEQPTATGWPRTYLVRGSVAGSVQIPQVQAAAFRFPGPYAPGDVVGKIELASAGGDSSTFSISELTQ